MSRMLQNAVARLKTRVLLAISRALLDTIDTSTGLSTVQCKVGANETRSGMELLEPYGFTSVPFAGAEGGAVYVGGNRDHGLIFNLGNRQFRLKNLPEGEVALYDDQGQVVHLKRNGELLVKATLKATVEAPTIEAKALTGAGLVNATATVAITLTAPVINLVGAISGGPGGSAPSLAVDATKAELRSAPTGGARITAQGANVDAALT